MTVLCVPDCTVTASIMLQKYEVCSYSVPHSYQQNPTHCGGNPVHLSLHRPWPAWLTLSRSFGHKQNDKNDLDLCNPFVLTPLLSKLNGQPHAQATSRVARSFVQCQTAPKLVVGFLTL